MIAFDLLPMSLNLEKGRGDKEMQKKVGEWNTVLFLEVEEVKDICKLGQGEACCPFIVCGGNGFECWKMNSPGNGIIQERINKGTMNAKGKGCSDEEWDSLCDSC